MVKRVIPRLQMSLAGVGVERSFWRRSCSGAMKSQVPAPAVGGIVSSASSEGIKDAEKSMYRARMMGVWYSC